MVEFDRTAFIAKFQEEAGEYLQRLNEGVIMLESDPDDADLIEQMLRDAHTLKGSSRMVGLIDISDIAHRLEDIMVRVREREIAFVREMSDVFFEALDAIVFLTDNPGEEGAGQIDVAGLSARLAEYGGDEPEPPVTDEVDGEDAPDETVEPDDAEAGRGSEADTEDVSEAASGEVPLGEEPAERAVPRAKKSQTIRVRTDQLDSLLNMVSEVVIGQIKSQRRATELRTLQADLVDVQRVWSRLRAQLEGHEAALSLVEGFLEDVGMLDHLLAEYRSGVTELYKGYADDVSRSSSVVADLQEQGMRLRMLPAQTVFDSFPRAVRDLAREFGKEVEFVMEGADTELDKKVLEEINDPLVHILRNSIDHGIEPPDEREAAGKPRAGTIRMAASQEGDHIVIEVSDDGAGIDPDSVKAAAVKRGYISQTEADALSDREAVFLVFERGFSTSPIITEISGRGVGMDVVREFIVDKLKGSMNIDSERGCGTTIRLTIPLTLAIIRALILRVGEQVFAIPTTSIEETLRIDPSEPVKAEGREVIRRQRRNVPLARLGDVLGVPHGDVLGRKIPIVTLGFSGQRLGFLVDELLGERPIVIKSLGSHLRGVDNVAGVTILGAGEVVVILNVPDLMDNARRMSDRRGAQAPADTQKGPRHILICEDSFTTRELERSIFEAAGYQVDVATDGRMGLEKLKAGLEVDAVVTDVQMPNLTGFELTKAIKSDDSLKHIPVVIVTSLERSEEKAEGVQAGADAYITKSVFNQDTLLDTVERLIR
jgi:two-component system chemotaxis sensor kinase CheA